METHWKGSSAVRVCVLTTIVIVLTALAAGQGTTPEAIEEEARAIEAALIAPCCFSQQVSVHQSPAAEELRLDIRRRLAAGEMRQQILDAYVQRYGTRVLAEPPARGFSITLYVVPPLLFVASIGLIVLLVRRYTRSEGERSGGDVLAGEAGGLEYARRLDEQLRDLD
jgi:cytochrome c-type biogenesis protein CcmH